MDYDLPMQRVPSIIVARSTSDHRTLTPGPDHFKPKPPTWRSTGSRPLNNDTAALEALTTTICTTYRADVWSISRSKNPALARCPRGSAQPVRNLVCQPDVRRHARSKSECRLARLHFLRERQARRGFGSASLRSCSVSQLCLGSVNPIWQSVSCMWALQILCR